jgi:hypothetical protein
MRTVTLKKKSVKHASADFYVLFSSDGKPRLAKFISGSHSLEELSRIWRWRNTKCCFQMPNQRKFCGAASGLRARSLRVYVRPDSAGLHAFSGVIRCASNGIPCIPTRNARPSSRQLRLAVCHRAVRLPKTLDISACQTRTQGTSTKARTDSGYSGASQLFVVGISALLGITGFRIDICMASFCKGGGVRILASSMACVSMADTVLLTARYSFRLLAIKFPNIMSRRSAHLSGSW